MNFTKAIENQLSRTKNGMKARQSSADANTDLFFKIGAMRGQNVIPEFTKAYVENSGYALRIAQWARDIRGGSGERQLFRDILRELSEFYPVTAMRLMDKVPEIGRWDDLLLDFKNIEVKEYGYSMIAQALNEGNGLCAKWMPRKGLKAVDLRKFLDLTPKQYRKTLVGLTNVVETQMCNKEWNKINFSHVPSLAASRYKGAFYRNAEAKFKEYVDKLVKGDKSVKVNAGAVYPYDILKGMFTWNGLKQLSTTEKQHACAQWDALENFIGDAKIFPMVDVSGSMCTPVGGSNISCMEAAVSLGLYCADKNTGVFKDSWLTFSMEPTIEVLKGNIIQKIQSMVTNRNWGMNTNLNAAFEKILEVAVTNKVSQEDMPETLVIFSDMQFDRCVQFDDSAFQMMSREYENAGYVLPQIIFWNLNSYDNVPVAFNQQGTALVSGFSPAIMKSILAADFEEFTPEAIMKQTIMNERYDI